MCGSSCREFCIRKVVRRINNNGIRNWKQTKKKKRWTYFGSIRKTNVSVFCAPCRSEHTHFISLCFVIKEWKTNETKRKKKATATEIEINGHVYTSISNALKRIRKTYKEIWDTNGTIRRAGAKCKTRNDANSRHKTHRSTRNCYAFLLCEKQPWYVHVIWCDAELCAFSFPPFDFCLPRKEMNNCLALQTEEENTAPHRTIPRHTNVRKKERKEGKRREKEQKICLRFHSLLIQFEKLSRKILC